MGFKRDDIRKWFEEAGLKDVNLDCVGENCCTTSSCGKEMAQISIFIGVYSLAQACRNKWSYGCRQNSKLV
jgi:hypothetical protein